MPSARVPKTALELVPASPDFGLAGASLRAALVATYPLSVMNARTMHARASGRTVLRLGVAVLGVAVLAGAWEFWASQSPGSMFYIGMLPAPFERLRADALTFGILLWLAGRSVDDRRERAPSARTVAALVVGACLLLGCGFYAAIHGMPGVQLQDLRPDATWVALGKLLGRACLVVGLAVVVWPVIAGAPRDGSA